jgi:hypothetical protein
MIGFGGPRATWRATAIANWHLRARQENPNPIHIAAMDDFS